MKVTLRRLEADDSAMVYAWRTSREVAQWMISDGPIPREDHAKWFVESLIDGPTRVRIVSCGDVDCGVLSWTAESNFTFSFGIYVVRSLTPVKRVGSAALFILLRHLFEEANAQVVRAEVLVENGRAIKTYESLGFSRELGLKRRVLRQVGMSDIIEMRICRNIWENYSPIVERELSTRGLVDEPGE